MERVCLVCKEEIDQYNPEKKEAWFFGHVSVNDQPVVEGEICKDCMVGKFICSDCKKFFFQTDDMGSSAGVCLDCEGKKEE